MPTKVELNKDAVRQAFELQIASLKRAMNSSRKPEFKALYEKDIAELQHAINTMTDK